MRPSSTISHIFFTTLFLIGQVVLFGKLNIYDKAFSFVFIFMVLIAPQQNGVIGNLILAFLMGLFVDVFNGTLGINALCCVLVSFLRNYLYQAVTNKTKDEILLIDFSLKTLGFRTFILFITPCVLIYTTTYFFLDAPQGVFFWRNLLMAFLSAIYTITMILALNFLLLSKRRFV